MKPTIDIHLLAAATGLLINSAWPAIAQVSHAPADRAAAEVSSDRHGPPTDVTRLPDGTVANTVWSGYVVTGSAFTSVYGSWTVPEVNCGSTLTTKSAFWVGIDGAGSPTVEQTGTSSDCNSGTPHYWAWYEFYPEDSVQVSLSISPADRMSAEVSYSNKQFLITITDETTHQTISTSGNPPHADPAQRISAECIAESPSVKVGTKIEPTILSLFGSASFGDDYTGVGGTCNASDSSASGPFGSFGNIEKYVLEDTSKTIVEAAPSPLSADGSSFSVSSSAINVTNLYGLPGTANVTILNSAGSQLLFTAINVPGSAGNTTPSEDVFLTGLKLAPGSYTFKIQATGSSGFGPGFMNFQLAGSPNISFTNGNSGLTYENQPAVSLPFTVL